MDLRLFGYFTARSPISHIGESSSTTTFLVQQPILQPDGEIEDVFCYNGNAWRGQLRDLAASYFLDRIGSPQIPLDVFHLLFSGGKIGGDQQVNLEQVRQYRRIIPALALWGGGVGNQILPGKMRVSNAYPVCIEALPVLRHTPTDLVAASYRSLTTEISHTRTDDSKDDRRQHLIALPAPEQAALLGDGEPENKSKAKKAGGDKEVSTQMRMTAEVLIAGARLETHIDLIDVSEIELGCLVSAIHAFARSPHIGGLSGKGYGLVDLSYDLLDLETGERQPFAGAGPDGAVLAPPAEAAKQAYDAYVQTIYDAYLDAKEPEIRKLLGVA